MKTFGMKCFKKCYLEHFSEEIEVNHKKSVRDGLHYGAHWTKCIWSRTHEGRAETYEQANFTTK